MLKRLQVRGFKSLTDIDVCFPALTVLFGPNAAGKSNILDALQALSRIGTSRTLSDALDEPIRGRQIEAFAFGAGGLPKLLASPSASFSLAADVATHGAKSYRYRVGVEINPASGSLSVSDEYLAELDRRGEPIDPAAIEQVEGKLRLRRKSKGKPLFEATSQNYAMLSDRRRVAPEYSHVERTRSELSSWRMYYLDPRVAMRAERSPADVSDIGLLGEDIAPFLFRLKSEHPKRFASVLRTLRALIPSVEQLTIDLDPRRGTLDVMVRQGGIDFSSRIVSEGTLRVLALCAIAANPWHSSLLAFEEPENGVHPKRLELIAQLVASLALDQQRQIIVTTHSPLFCDAVLRFARARPGDVALLSVRRGPQGTVVTSFRSDGPLFSAHEISDALAASSEDGLFQKLLLRGFIDE